MTSSKMNVLWRKLTGFQNTSTSQDIDQKMALPVTKMHSKENKMNAKDVGDLLFLLMVEYIGANYENVLPLRKSSKRMQKMILQPLQKWLFVTKRIDRNDGLRFPAFCKFCGDAHRWIMEFYVVQNLKNQENSREKKFSTNYSIEQQNSIDS